MADNGNRFEIFTLFAVNERYKRIFGLNAEVDSYA